MSQPRPDSTAALSTTQGARRTTTRGRRKTGARAMLMQGAFAAVALVGGISVAEFGKREHARTVADALAARTPAADAPFQRQQASAAELAVRYQRAGYAVSQQLAETIVKTAERYRIEPEVAFGLVRTESGFSNRATSPVGAIGMAQLMPRTAAWVRPGTTVSQLRDPALNLDVGFEYLRQLIDRYDGNVEMALLAYNRGPGTVDRIVARGGNPDNGYPSAVLRGAAKRRG